MALTDVLSHLWVPGVGPWVQNANLSFSSLALAATNDKVALVFVAPKTGNIRKVEFRSNAHTTNGDADVRLETVSSGDPSGTLAGTNANATVTINAANSWFVGALTTACAVTAGTAYAITWVNTTGNTTVAALSAASFPLTNPYGLTKLSAGAYIKNTARPSAAIEYDDSTYGYLPGVHPFTTLNTVTYNNTTAIGSGGSERGNKITVEYGARSWGFWAYIDPDNNADIKLYDSTNTLFTGCSVAVTNLGRGGTNSALFVMPWPTKPTLSANSVVYLTLSPSSASNVSLIDGQVNSTAIFAGTLEGGASVQLVSRAGGTGSFDATATTRRAYMGLIFDQIDLGGAGIGRLVGGGLAR